MQPQHNPLDLIPDVIPVLRLLDGAAVISMCLIVVEQDLRLHGLTRTAATADREGRQGVLRSDSLMALFLQILGLCKDNPIYATIRPSAPLIFAE